MFSEVELDAISNVTTDAAHARISIAALSAAARALRETHGHQYGGGAFHVPGRA